MRPRFKAYPIASRLFLPLLCSAMILSAAGCSAKTNLPIHPPKSTVPSISTPAPSGDFSWLHISPPSGWHETAPGRYQGADGYAWLELRSGPGLAGSATALDAACMIEANRAKPQTYGAYPEIRAVLLENQPGCLILPSSDQPAGQNQEALYLLAIPASIHADTLLALHADRSHIEGISQKLAFAQPLLAQPLPTQPPAACDFSVAGQAARTTQQAGIRIDEFPIARGENCSPTRDPQNFSQRIQSGAPFTRAEEVRGRLYAGARLARLNARLAPFGFQVQTYDPQLFKVLKGGKVVKSNLSWLGQVSVRADGNDFIFPVVDSYNATSFIIRPDGVHSLDSPDLLVFDLVFPVYAGSDRINLDYDYQHISRTSESPALLRILKNDQVIETLSISGSSPASGPVRGLWSWDGHWFLELPGLVLEDGQILNQRLGYPEIFTWRLLNDKPFYFYRKDNQVHAVYENQALPNPFDEVIAGPQFSDQMLVQMRAYDSGLVFFARRGNTWYYVVLAAE